MKTLVVDSEHAAHEPPEARGVDRDNVRMMVSKGTDSPIHSTFRSLPEFLSPGDLVVINTSGTIPAAIDAMLLHGEHIVLHVSTELPGGLWMVEPRQPTAGGATEPLRLAPDATRILLTGGTEIDLLRLLLPPKLSSSIAQLRPGNPPSRRLPLAASEPKVDPPRVGSLEVGKPVPRPRPLRA